MGRRGSSTLSSFAPVSARIIDGSEISIADAFRSIELLDNLGCMNRLIRSSEVVVTAEIAECNCPDDCEVDHDNS
jgi:hypothetical protein